MLKNLTAGYNDVVTKNAKCAGGETVFYVLLPMSSRLSFSGIPDVVEIRADICADKSADFIDFFEYRRIIKRVSPDIVHTHGAVVARIAAATLGIPTVMTRHCAYPVKLIKFFPFRQINSLLYMRFTDFCIATAEAAKKNLTDMGIPDEKIRVIINGSPEQKRISETEKREIIEQLGCDGCFIVGVVGRLEKEKGHRTILDAARILSGEKIRFLFFGDGKCEDELKEYAEGLDNVLFCGFKPDIYRYMNIFDIEVNASTGTETSCLALSEAMSLKIPCIASDYGGNPHMIGKNGLIFPHGDATSLAECVLRLYRDRGLYESLSESSYKRYKKDFTVQRMQQEYGDIYAYVLDNAKKEKRRMT